MQQIAEKINKAILKETTKKTESNATDKLAKLVTSIPGPLIKLVVNTLMWMDRHNIMPKAVIEASPFHTTLFLTNLRSLGINHIYHLSLIHIFCEKGFAFFVVQCQYDVVCVHDNNSSLNVNTEENLPLLTAPKMQKVYLKR